MVGFAPQPNGLNPPNPDTADLGWMVEPPASPLAPQDPSWTYGQVLPMAEKDDAQGNPHYKWAWPGAVRSLAQGAVDLARGAHGDTGGTITPEAENALLAYAARGLGGKGNPNDLGMFLGRKAAQGPNTPMAWFRGTDLQPRFEISDWNSGINWDNYHQNLLKAQGEMGKNWDENIAHGTSLGNIFDHPELYANYPGLKNLDVTFDPKLSASSGYAGLQYPSRGPYEPFGRIEIDSSMTPAQQHSVLLHEIQHGIQGYEGFEGGGNRDWAWDKLNQAKDVLNNQFSRVFDNWNNEGRPQNSPNFDTLQEIAARSNQIEEWMRTHGPDNAYRSIAGEVEARNVQKRFDIQRQAALGRPDVTAYWNKGNVLTRPPEETADVPPSKQFIFGSNLEEAPPMPSGSKSYPSLHPVEHNPYAPPSPTNPVPVEHDPFAP